MSDGDDIGPVPERLTVVPAQVRRMIAEQFPHWADLPVRPVAQAGWDNLTFHLGDRMLARLPSGEPYALAVEKEHRWLPVLAPRLPFPVPVPLGRGRPGAGYPFAWSVYGWLDGPTATFDAVTDPVGLADDLAAFVLALRAVDAADGPRPGLHNWYRGGPLRAFDSFVDESLATLGDRVDASAVRGWWDDARSAPWDGVDVWFHGDLAQGNLLLDSGRLGAVIDFGTCGVGDPACDLAIAWTLLTPEGRERFRTRLGVGDAEWTRGRGWALWKTLTRCAEGGEDADDAWRVLEQISG